jgi:putative membrane protein
MPIVAQVFAALAAVLHVFFFYLESVVFTQPATWKRFGVKSQADADTVKSMAYNQGFYNLFLALGVLVGIVLIHSSHAAAGRGIVLFGCACMLGAALVLASTGRSYARAALIQGLFPTIAILITAIA